MNAGRLTERVVFEKKTLTLVNGQYVTSWATDVTLSAEALRISEQNARFTIRYNPNIRPDTHRIIFWSAIWTVVNAVHDLRHTMTTIDSDFSALIEATHLQSTTREYIDGLPIVRPPE